MKSDTDPIQVSIMISTSGPQFPIKGSLSLSWIGYIEENKGEPYET
jgi:hypothetical protein